MATYDSLQTGLQTLLGIYPVDINTHTHTRVHLKWWHRITMISMPVHAMISMACTVNYLIMILRKLQK